MDTQEIGSILKRDRYTRHAFRGVFASDALPHHVTQRPSAFVVNTDPAEKPGQHWIAIYLRGDGAAEYFDSYGLPPQLPEFKLFLKKNASDIRVNHQRLQGPFSAVCGQYSIFFLLHRCRGLTIDAILRMFSPSDVNSNDVNVNNFIRKHFPRMNTFVFDDQLFLQQVSRALLQQQHP